MMMANGPAAKIKSNPFQIVHNGHRYMCTYLAESGYINVKVYGIGTKTLPLNSGNYTEVSKIAAMEMISGKSQ